MPIITYDDFAGGLDVRPASALSKANILRVLQNAYITTGKSIRKRPCLEFVATLEPGTVGLKAFGGKLNTFYGDGAAITHANSLFVPRRVPHWITGVAPTKIHYCDQYNGIMYVAAAYSVVVFGNPTIVFRHHYLDDPGAWSALGAVLQGAYRRPTVANGFRYEASVADPGAWAPATAYTVGQFRRPTTPNGFRYEVTAILGTGTSGGVEPVWPTTPGSTVIDNPGANQVTWACRVLVGGVEPVWPITVGTPVVDNQVTWTCRTFAITDANCPHTKRVAKQAQKIFADGLDGTTVRFCKTGDPRDWTAAADAGFLPAGLYARGSSQVMAIAPFSNSSLAVLFEDNLQVWKVDPNPASHSLTSNIEGVGTRYHRAAGPVSQDLFFPAQNGFRSLSLLTLTQNLQDNDVGSPIDSLVRASLAESDDPLGLFYQRLGQFWSINNAIVWAYSFSRTSKISAWSKFTFPFTVDDAAVLNQELYVRTGNDVYKVSDAIYKDGVSSIPLVDVQMFYQDGKAPGVLKQFVGMDVIGKGTPTISHKFAADQETLETAGVEYPALTEPGSLYPVELISTRIAPHITHQKDEEFELSALMLHFEKLGTV
jgi:hypothetical protein